MGGQCSLTLAPGQGLRELKTMIRQAFGKYEYHKLSKLTLGASGGAEVKSNHLVDGCTVQCHYTFAQGDIGAIHGRRGRRGGGFGGAFRRGGAMRLVMPQGATASADGGGGRWAPACERQLTGRQLHLHAAAPSLCSVNARVLWVLAFSWRGGEGSLPRTSLVRARLWRNLHRC